MQINADHATYSLCICLYLIKIIKDLDQSFRCKRPLTQQSPPFL